LATFDGPDDELIRVQETERLRRAVAEELEVLDKRERHIARMRFLAEQPLPLSTLGDHFGVSRERVRQLAERTRKKLQTRLRRRGFC
jgi:RNA polymerase sigma-32 factor